MRFQTFYPMIAFSAPITDAKDIGYVTTAFADLTALKKRYGYCYDDVRELVALAILPRPSFGMADGSLYVPPSYFENACTRQTFQLRLAAAARRLDLSYTAREMELRWTNHVSGGLGVCFEFPTPENAVFADWCIVKIEKLLRHPKPAEAAWLKQLVAPVRTLEKLTREITTFDRQRGVGLARVKYVEALQFEYGLL